MKTKNPIEISVIILTLNEERNIESSLKALLNQTLPREKYEVIVSDGASSDRTVEIARKYADKVVVSKKRGIWWGRNFGAKFAKGKYFVFTDADTMFDRDYLEFVLKNLKEKYIAVSTGFRFTNKSLKMKMACKAATLFYLSKKLLGHPYILGFNFCISREAFDKIGGFEDYGLEDLKMSKELQKYGKTTFLPRAKLTTSSRRLENFGLFGALRYYLELMLIQEANIKNPEKHRLLKYRSYKPAHVPSGKKK